MLVRRGELGGRANYESDHRISCDSLRRYRAVLGLMGYFVLGAASLIAAIPIGSALKMANTWHKFVILRAGKLRGVKGPGLFVIIPVVDSVVAVIDERIQTTAFSAQEALTKDTVPVNVDAIISGSSMMHRKRP